MLVDGDFNLSCIDWNLADSKPVGERMHYVAKTFLDFSFNYKLLNF